MASGETRGFTPRALGEIAIRCEDLEAMTAFYRDALGLSLLARRDERIVFFALGESFGGHTAVLALFQAEDGRPETGARSSLHHLALALPREEQDAAVAWLTACGAPVEVEEFPWIGWRGVFTRDPEGNTVELVARDPKVGPM